MGVGRNTWNGAAEGEEGNPLVAKEAKERLPLAAVGMDADVGRTRSASTHLPTPADRVTSPPRLADTARAGGGGGGSGASASAIAASSATITGLVVDQAALHGLLERVRGLGLLLISVIRLPCRP